MSKKITPEELMTRWRKASKKPVYTIIHRYTEILKPIKIGRRILIDQENVEKFENDMRIANDE